MLLQLESVVLFVHDIDAAAAWYAALLGVPVEHENPRYAFLRAPHGVIIGFHPADAKSPGGVPGTTPYREVAAGRPPVVQTPASRQSNEEQTARSGQEAYRQTSLNANADASAQEGTQDRHGDRSGNTERATMLGRRACICT